MEKERGGEGTQNARAASSSPSIRRAKTPPLEAYRASTSGKPRFIPWAGLKEQLGANFKNEDEFRRKAREALRKVKTFYPRFNLSDNAAGLTIPATAYPAIAPRDAEFLAAPAKRLK